MFLIFMMCLYLVNCHWCSWLFDNKRTDLC